MSVMMDQIQYDDMRVEDRSGEVENPYSLKSSTAPHADLFFCPLCEASFVSLGHSL